MRKMTFFVLILGLSCSSWLASAQVIPGAASSPHPSATPMTNPQEELPTALGFVVEQRTAAFERNQQVIRFQLTEKFPDSALRIKEICSTSKVFGGGHRLIGWSHQYQGDRWGFTLFTPRGEKYFFTLQATENGRTLMTFETRVDIDKSLRFRRPYDQTDDLGARPPAP